MYFAEQQEPKRLRHIWIYNKEQSERFAEKDWFVKAYVCNTCDATKIVSKTKRITSITYLRNGRIGEYIECIDIEKENNKTID